MSDGEKNRIISSRFNRILTCDKRTDGQTSWDSIVHYHYYYHYRYRYRNHRYRYHYHYHYQSMEFVKRLLQSWTVALDRSKLQ